MTEAPPTPAIAQERDTPITVRAVVSTADETVLLRIPAPDRAAGRDPVPILIRSAPRQWLRPGAAIRAEADDDAAILEGVHTLGGGSRTVAVIGAKGGVGTTTVALLAGALLAAVPEARPALVELADDWGTTGQLLGSGDGPTVVDLLAHLTAAHRAGLRFVQGFMTPWNCLPVLLAPPDPALAARLTTTDYARTLRLLTANYHLVLLDCGPSLTHPLTQFALGTADHVVLIIGPDPAALQRTDRAIAFLTDSGRVAGRVSGNTHAIPGDAEAAHRVRARTEITLVVNGADAAATRALDTPVWKEVMPTLNAVLTVPRSEPLQQQFGADTVSIATLPTPTRRALKTLLAAVLGRLAHL